jgi:RecJ-like exonuclease
LKRAEEAADLIRHAVEGGGFVHVVSHLDADGLAAAGVIATALARLDAVFCVRIERWLDEKILQSIIADEPGLIVFCDFGSGDLPLVSSCLSGRRVVILDHHQPVGVADAGFIHVNPHVFGVDGSRDLSAAGVAYFVAKALDKASVDLACVAVVGALGDLQDKYEARRLGELNSVIVDDAVAAGFLGLESDLLFFGRETRPIHQALARTTTPFIPGISGEEDKSLAFLVGLGIPPKRDDRWRALRDLSDDERKRLFNALVDYLMSRGLSSDVALSIRGTVYTLVREEPWTVMRDGREFSVLLNATGRMDKAGLGVAVCMGDRGAALEEANAVLDEYRRTIMKYLGWLLEPDSGRVEELENIFVARGQGVIDDKIIGTISSILSMSLSKPEKPILAYSVVEGESLVKVSARSTDSVVKRGLNLGEVLRVVAEGFGGKGGGHNIAAGAQVPVGSLDVFLRSVDELVKKQLAGG